MGDTADDQVFLGLIDQGHGDGADAVAARGHTEAGVVGECIDQPGLTPGEVPDPFQGRGGEGLAGLIGVLGEQRSRLRGLKSPSHSDSALMLKALPPVMGFASERAWMR